MAIISRGDMVHIAPQSLGETTPVFSDAWFAPEEGLSLLKQHATFAKMYEEQIWVGSVIDKIAGGIARLDLQVWDYSNPDSKVRATDSAYARLLANPCAYMSTFAFKRWVASTYEIYGEAFALKLRDASGAVVSLIPMHPSRTTIRRIGPIPTAEEIAAGWRPGDEVFVFDGGAGLSGTLEAGRSDVVAWRRYNANNTMRGHSRMTKLRNTIFTEDASRRAANSFWTRGARPTMVIEHPSAIRDAKQLGRLKTQWNSFNAGADRMGGTVILEEGAKAHVISLSPDEMQFIQTRMLSREEVCAGYDIPPPVVGILDKATYSNINAQLLSVYKDVMPPRLEDLESQLDFDLRGEFPNSENLRAEFGLDDILRGDFDARADAAVKLVNTAIMTPSEARQIFDLPRKDEQVSDKLYANAALVPLGSTPQSVILPGETRAEVAQAQEAVRDPEVPASELSKRPKA